ncbi:MAG: hypothetical protein ACREV6_12075 [Clostridium sp.]|uniref:hypothetical protein n=1 Tax=Clostridium sp. TaxID=1506 RepID=UPI003D6D561D
MNIKQSKTKNSLFFVMTILSAAVYLITSLSSFTLYDNDLTILLILSFMMIIFSFIGSVVGVMVVKPYFKQSITVKTIILLGLLLVNIIILLRSTIILTITISL